MPDDDLMQSDDFRVDLRLTLQGRHRRNKLPWLVVGLALVGSASFWQLVERLWSGGG